MQRVPSVEKRTQWFVGRGWKKIKKQKKIWIFSNKKKNTWNVWFTYPGTVCEYANAILKNNAWNKRSRTVISEFWLVRVRVLLLLFRILLLMSGVSGRGLFSGFTSGGRPLLVSVIVVASQALCFTFWKYSVCGVFFSHL